MNPTLLNGGIKPLSVAILFALSGQKAFAEGNIDRNTDQKNKKKRKSKLKAQNNLALNLWDAYFQKPFESTSKKPLLGTGKKIKVK